MKKSSIPICILSAVIILTSSGVASAGSISGRIVGHTYELSAPATTEGFADVKYSFTITCGGFAGMLATFGKPANMPVTISLMEKDWSIDDPLRFRNGKKVLMKDYIFCTMQDAQNNKTKTFSGTFQKVNLKKAKGLADGGSVEIYARLQIDVPRVNDVDGTTKLLSVKVGNTSQKVNELFSAYKCVGTEWQYRSGTYYGEEDGFEDMTLGYSRETVRSIIPAANGFTAIINRDSTDSDKQRTVTTRKELVRDNSIQVNFEFSGRHFINETKHPANVSVTRKTVKVRAGTYSAVCFTVADETYYQICYAPGVGVVLETSQARHGDEYRSELIYFKSGNCR